MQMLLVTLVNLFAIIEQNYSITYYQILAARFFISNNVCKLCYYYQGGSVSLLCIICACIKVQRISNVEQCTLLGTLHAGAVYALQLHCTALDIHSTLILVSTFVYWM